MLDGSDLAALSTAHLHFARWERVRHRARTIALIAFPDTNPFRMAVDAVCNALEECRHKADLCLQRVVNKYGPFRGVVNGYFFESPHQDLFKSSA